MSEERKSIREPDLSIYMRDIFDGEEVQEALRKFNNICNDHYIKMKEKWPDATLTFDYSVEENYVDFIIETYRGETDQEMYDRQHKEEANAKRNRETRYKNYLALKQEFEPE